MFKKLFHSVIGKYDPEDFDNAERDPRRGITFILILVVIVVLCIVWQNAKKDNNIKGVVPVSAPSLGGNGVKSNVNNIDNTNNTASPTVTSGGAVIVTDY